MSAVSAARSRGLQPRPAADPTLDDAIWAREIYLSYRRMRRQPATTKDVAIHLLKGQFGFDVIAALRGVSLRVHRGEILGVIGPNGAGKSSLLKVLARVLLPTSGRVVVRGRTAPMIELGAGFDAELTARENIVLYGALLGREPRALRRRAAAIAEWAGLDDMLDEPLRTFSSGMLARLAFAIGVDSDPDVLLVDEVLAVGDAAFQVRSQERMRELLAGGAAVVLVSHAGEVLRRLSDRVLWLDRGQVIACGHAPSVVAAYERQVLAENASIRIAR